MFVYNLLYSHNDKHLHIGHKNVSLIYIMLSHLCFRFNIFLITRYGQNPKFIHGCYSCNSFSFHWQKPQINLQLWRPLNKTQIKHIFLYIFNLINFFQNVPYQLCRGHSISNLPGTFNNTHILLTILYIPSFQENNHLLLTNCSYPNMSTRARYAYSFFCTNTLTTIFFQHRFISLKKKLRVTPNSNFLDRF